MLKYDIKTKYIKMEELDSFIKQIKIWLKLGLIRLQLNINDIKSPC